LLLPPFTVVEWLLSDVLTEGGGAGWSVVVVWLVLVVVTAGGGAGATLVVVVVVDWSEVLSCALEIPDIAGVIRSAAASVPQTTR
jgi:hypothetical protein